MAENTTSDPSRARAQKRTAVASGNEGCATKVFVRVRPFSEKETRLAAAGGAAPCPVIRVDAADPCAVTTLDPAKGLQPKDTYLFEYCFDNTAAAGGRTSGVLMLPPPAPAAAAADPSSPRPSLTLTEGGDSVTAGASASEEEQQADIYARVGQPVLANALEGYNGCVFAYGQTGSGKTYTMMGLGGPGPGAGAGDGSTTARLRRKASTAGLSPRAGQAAHSPPPTARLSTGSLEGATTTTTGTRSASAEGLVPRLVCHLFRELQAKRQKDSSHSFTVEMEYFEIYNEKVMDLLVSGSENNNNNNGGGSGGALRVRNSLKGPFVEGLTRQRVADEAAVLRWLLKGAAERHTAATRMNEHSSRSHAILVLHLVQMRFVAEADGADGGSTTRTTSKLNLVDLAGSERTGVSGVVGRHFTEATKINLSLTTLGRVIDALAEASQGHPGVFCPYRDSNLTWLLMDSLGGNSKTTMIATVSPHAVNFEESCQTLRYAARAKQIVTRAVVNEDPQVRQIKVLTAEVRRLQALLEAGGSGTAAAAATCACVGEDEEDEYVAGLRRRVLELEAEAAERQEELDGAYAEIRQLKERRQQARAGAVAREVAGKETAKLRAEIAKLEDENLAILEVEEELRKTKTRLSAAERRLETAAAVAEQESRRLHANMRRLERRNAELEELREQWAAAVATDGEVPAGAVTVTGPEAEGATIALSDGAWGRWQQLRGAARAGEKEADDGRDTERVVLLQPFVEELLARLAQAPVALSEEEEHQSPRTKKPEAAAAARERAKPTETTRTREEPPDPLALRRLQDDNRRLAIELKELRRSAKAAAAQSTAELARVTANRDSLRDRLDALKKAQLTLKANSRTAKTAAAAAEAIRLELFGTEAGTQTEAGADDDDKDDADARREIAEEEFRARAALVATEAETRELALGLFMEAARQLSGAACRAHREHDLVSERLRRWCGDCLEEWGAYAGEAEAVFHAESLGLLRAAAAEDGARLAAAARAAQQAMELERTVLHAEREGRLGLAHEEDCTRASLRQALAATARGDLERASAQLAEQKQRLVEELQSTEDRVRAVQSLADETDRRLCRCEGERQSALARADALEAERRRLQGAMEDVDAQRLAAEEASTALQQRLDSATATHAEALATIATLTAALDAMTAELKDTERQAAEERAAQADALARAAQQHAEERAQQSAALNSVGETCDALRTALEGAEARREALAAQVSSLSAELESARQSATAARDDQAARTQSDAEEHTRQRRALEESHAKALDDKNALIMALERSASLLSAQLAQSAEAQRATIAGLQSQLDEGRGELGRARAEAAALRASLAEAEAQSGPLRTRLAAADEAAQELTAQLKEAQRGRASDAGQLRAAKARLEEAEAAREETSAALERATAELARAQEERRVAVAERDARAVPEEPLLVLEYMHATLELAAGLEAEKSAALASAVLALSADAADARVRRLKQEKRASDEELQAVFATVKLLEGRLKAARAAAEEHRTSALHDCQDLKGRHADEVLRLRAELRDSEAQVLRSREELERSRGEWAAAEAQLLARMQRKDEEVARLRDDLEFRARLELYGDEINSMNNSFTTVTSCASAGPSPSSYAAAGGIKRVLSSIWRRCGSANAGSSHHHYNANTSAQPSRDVLSAGSFVDGINSTVPMTDAAPFAPSLRHQREGYTAALPIQSSSSSSSSSDEDNDDETEMAETVMEEASQPRLSSGSLTAAATESAAPAKPQPTIILTEDAIRVIRRSQGSGSRATSTAKPHATDSATTKAHAKAEAEANPAAKARATPKAGGGLGVRKENMTAPSPRVIGVSRKTRPTSTSVKASSKPRTAPTAKTTTTVSSK